MTRSIFFGSLLLLLSACADPGLSPGEGHIDVEGGRVWYRIAGSGNETPLLLLHGGPGFPGYYLNPLEGVSVDRPVVFYDQLGAGRSDRPDDVSLWRVDRFVAELAIVREALGLDEVHILGHSWGTMLAVDYMLTEPQGVKSLILASPALNVPQWTVDTRALLTEMPADIQRVVNYYEEKGQTDAPEYQEAVMAFYKRYLAITDPWPEDMLLTFEHANLEIYGLMWGPSEFTATGTLKDYNREDVLPDLDLPVLFTTGRYDEAVPETVAHFQSLVPGAEFIIFENSAHLTMIDDPEAYIDAVRDFLNDVDSGR